MGVYDSKPGLITPRATGSKPDIAIYLLSFFFLSCLLGGGGFLPGYNYYTYKSPPFPFPVFFLFFLKQLFGRSSCGLILGSILSSVFSVTARCIYAYSLIVAKPRLNAVKEVSKRASSTEKHFWCSRIAPGRENPQGSESNAASATIFMLFAELDG